MNNSELIKSYKKIYSDIGLPNIIINHQINVAIVGSIICDNWKGKKIDKELVVAAALIHDITNIIKLSFDDISIKLLENEDNPVDYWKKQQKQFIEKYGDNQKEAFKKILINYDLDKKLFFLVDNAEFENIGFILDSDCDELKILKYSDLRVSPEGITSIDNRLKEAQRRYISAGKRIETMTKNWDFLYNTSKKLEKQILQNCFIDLLNIDNNTIKNYYKQFE